MPYIKQRIPARSFGLFAVFLLAAGLVHADQTRQQIYAARARAEFQRALRRFQSDTNDAAAAWQFGRACFDWADEATNESQRADIARQGIAACRQLLGRQTNSAPGHYYLAMNDGQLAQAQAPSLASYRLVKQMEREFKMAAELDKSLDYAGPARSLGLLYRDAPGWPVSIGSRRKAREYLEQAVTIAPDYPENELNLAETFLDWHDLGGAKKALKALDALWPAAQKHFTGQAWEQSWDDWSNRRAAAHKKLDDISAPAKSARGPN